MAVLADWPPVKRGVIPIILAGLSDQSLLVAIADPGGTRYRALETIRQYGADRLNDAGESEQARSRHLRWCLEVAAALDPPAGGDAGAWRAAFDQVADELRGALSWAATNSEYRAEAYRLAIMLADLSFARGMPGESQGRYEQAAELAADDGAAAAALHRAAGAAESRHFGTEALRLRRAAADAALRAGDRAAAAVDLARAAELILRGPGLMATAPPVGEVDTLLTEAWALAAGDPAAEARVLTAEAFNGADTDPVTAELAERAVELARRVGDPLTESAALDQLTAVQLARGELRAAAASALRRTELLAPMRLTAVSGLELADAFIMATECAVAAGDLPAARDLAERVRDLPFYREEGHLATARLIVVAALAGDWDEGLTLAERFREGWERAGRPRAGNLSRAAYAAATVHGLRGDDDARAAWLDIVAALATPGRPLSQIHFGEFFDALLLLHRGHPEQALHLLGHAAGAVSCLVQRDVATVVRRAVGRGGRAHQERGRRRPHPPRTSSDAGQPDRRRPAAAGCRYQWARTLVLLGGAERVRG